MSVSSHPLARLPPPPQLPSVARPHASSRICSHCSPGHVTRLIFCLTFTSRRGLDPPCLPCLRLR